MKHQKIFVAGHNGMVGSSILDYLKSKGYANLVVRTRNELDLTKQADVNSFFGKERPDAVIICAAKVGGILANNTLRADFIYDNIQIASNLIHASHTYNVQKLINLGSSCIYPKHADIPIEEESLLTGVLEKTNEPYAIAKIAAIKMCESYYQQYDRNFYSIMPCNMYGPRDNFDLKSSHVLPALIRKVHEAKENGAKTIEVWGTGKPLREFLYVDDLAEMSTRCLECVDAIDVYEQGISHLNCGSEDEVTILELTNIIQDVVGYTGEIVFDSSKPDGTYRKKMNNRRMINLGCTPKHTLKQGLQKTYAWYLENKEKFV
jgi:GDP-L-fucose synthase